MSHEFVSGVFGSRQPAWHGLGEVVEGLMTTQTALEKSGVGGILTRSDDVFIQVGKKFVPVPDYVAVIREDNDMVMGIHSGGYVREEFADAFADLGAAFGPDVKLWETMVLLRQGRIAAGVMRFPELDRELIDGSHLMSYIAAYSSHDGSFALTYTDTNIRIECANKLRLAEGQSKSGLGRRFAIRHGNSMADRKREAIKVMSYAQERIDAVAEQAEKLLAKKISDKQLENIFNKLIPVNEEEGRGRTIALNRRAAILDIYNNADDQQGIRGTAWGVTQAFAAYTDHFGKFHKSKSGSAEENKFIATTLRGNTLADRAVALVS